MTTRQEVEIERKWLMTNIPEGFKVHKDIHQTYYFQDGKVQRVRREAFHRAQHGENARVDYIHCIKEPRGEGKIGNIEIIKDITKEEYEDIFLQYRSQSISKTRYILENKDGTVWECDDFHNKKLCMLEIEMPSDDYELVIPEEIKKYIIREVTGMKGFSNASLSTKG